MGTCFVSAGNFEPILMKLAHNKCPTIKSTPHKFQFGTIRKLRHTFLGLKPPPPPSVTPSVTPTKHGFWPPPSKMWRNLRTVPISIENLCSWCFIFVILLQNSAWLHSVLSVGCRQLREIRRAGSQSEGNMLHPHRETRLTGHLQKRRGFRDRESKNT